MAVPHIFEGNTPAVASQVNDNFDALVEEDAEIRGELDDAVNELEGAVNELEGEIDTKATRSLNNLDAAGQNVLAMKLDANKIQFVAALPENPDSTTLYLMEN